MIFGDPTLDWMAMWGDAARLTQREATRKSYYRHIEKNHAKRAVRSRAEWADPEHRAKEQLRKTSPKYKLYESQYVQKNQARRTEAHRAWVANNRERARKYDEQRRNKDRDAYNKQFRDRRAKNPERSRAQSRRFYWAHRDEIAAAQARVRAYRKAAPGRFTAEDISTILYEQHELCVYCRISLRDGFEIDHKTPLSRHGTNWPDNIQLTCRSCNRRKNAMTHEEYLARLQESAP